jgi:hypothetical protein
MTLGCSPKLIISFNSMLLPIRLVDCLLSKNYAAVPLSPGTHLEAPVPSLSSRADA